MQITELINHPERLDRNTLYELRSMLALYPYFQTARLLMLQNLYLLHDISFDEELRKAALYITDRKVIFQMIEAAHYQLRKEQKANSHEPKANSQGSRTVALIDSFLDSIPDDEEPKDKKRRPTPADAAIDYVAYLLETEGEQAIVDDTPQMKGQPSEAEPNDDNNDESNNEDEEYFTETLARIYIKQGRYQKALDIITRLSERYPHKNVYFADQIRFLEKLIINSENNSKKINNSKL
jgi:hypothetical protein